MKEIEALRDQFYRAHSNTSFSPEVRAEQYVRDFSEELAADLAELGERAGDYSAKYVQYLRTWAGRRSKCLSAMITGPARFPTERNRKAWSSADRACDEFRKWRARYIKRAFREPVKSPEEEIDDALVRLEQERNAHTLMVEVNKIMRRKVGDEEKCRALIEEMELKPETAENLMNPATAIFRGFAPYALTNSNARIKSLEEKVLTLRARITRRDAFEPIAFSGGSINIKDDRVVIKHDEKPAREIIDALKGCGFHWSPRGGYWCRKHTANALRDAKSVCGIAL